MSRGTSIPTRPIRRALLLALSLATPAAAQSVEYDVVRLPNPGDSIVTATGLNELGHVVGVALFSEAPTMRAWFWSAEDGVSVLPAPPGLATYRAIDVNADGAIAGDGGYDFGQAWRYAGGAYEMLGTLAGDPISTAAGIDAAGTIVGTSRTLTFSDPPDTFVSEPGLALQLVQSSSQAAYLNDAGQIVGWTSSLTAWRFTPGVGVEFLPPLGSHVLTYATSINARGDVVGYASLATGSGTVPFLYTDAGGMQPTGSFGGGASAADVSDDRVVVGTFSIGGTHPWIWTAQTGVRFLDDLIDPAEDLNLLSATRINEAGQILARAADLSTFARFPVLLVPREDCGIESYCATSPSSAGPGAVISASGSTSIAANDLELEVSGAPPVQSGLFYYGSTRLQIPFGEGLRCVGGSIFRLNPPLLTDALGRAVRAIDYTDPPSPAGQISAGARWHFQFWYRDPAGGGALFNLSDGLTAAFCP